MLESLEADDVSLLMIIEEHPGKSAAQLGKALSRGAMSINASIFNLKDKNLIIENRDNTFKVNERKLNEMNVKISKDSYIKPDAPVHQINTAPASAPEEKDDDVGTAQDQKGPITERMILAYLKEAGESKTATEISGHFGRKWGAVSAVLSKMTRNKLLIKYGIRYELPAEVKTVLQSAPKAEEAPDDIRRAVTSTSEIANLIIIKTKGVEWLTQQEVFTQLSAGFIIDRALFDSVFDQMGDIGQLVALDENDLVVSLETDYGPDLRYHALKDWSAKDAALLAGNFVNDRTEFTLKEFITSTMISPASAKLFLREHGFVFDGQIAYGSVKADDQENPPHDPPMSDAEPETGIEPVEIETTADEDVEGFEKHPLVSVETLDPAAVFAYIEDNAPTEQEFASHFHLIEDAEYAVNILCKLGLVHLDGFSGQVRLYNGPEPEPVTEEQVSELIRETCASSDVDAQAGVLGVIIDGMKGGKLAPAPSDGRENETVVECHDGSETRSYDLPGAHIEVESKVIESDGDFSDLYAQLERDEIAATSITLRGEAAVSMIKLHKALGHLDAEDVVNVIESILKGAEAKSPDENRTQSFDEKYGMEKYGMPDCPAGCTSLHLSEGISDRCIAGPNPSTVNPLWVQVLEVLEEQYPARARTARTIREIIDYLEQR